MDIKDMEGFECGHLIFIHRKNRVEIVEDFWMLVSRRPSIGGRPVGINYLLKRQEFERNMNYVFSDRIIRIGNPITAIYHRSED